MYQFAMGLTDKTPKSASKTLVKHDQVPKKRGRPQLLTLEIVQGISDRIAKGLTIEQACILAEPMISPKHFCTAIARNKEFGVAYVKAKANRIIKLLDVIEAGDSRDFKLVTGHTWLLERCYREQFGRDSSVNITNNHFAGLSVDMMSKVRSAARKAIQAPKVIDVKAIK